MSLNLSIRGENGAVPEPNVPMVLQEAFSIYPFCLSPLQIYGSDNIASLESAMRNDRLLAFFPEAPLPEQLDEKNLDFIPDIFGADGKLYCRVGVLARVVKTVTFPDGSKRILARGLRRIRHLSDGVNRQVRLVQYEDIPEPESSGECIAMGRAVTMLFRQLADVASFPMPNELKIAVLNSKNESRLADLLADSLNFDQTEKAVLLAADDLAERLKYLLILLNRELEVVQAGAQIQNEVHEAMSRSQRDFYLREQLRIIQQELNEDSRSPDMIEIDNKLNSNDLPEHVAEVVKREAGRLELIPQNAPEYHIAYSYINWLLDMPWRVFSKDILSVKRAAKILDSDHYGLRDVKDRILEALSVMQLKKSSGKAPILCLVGPPGVGKTSLGKSIARAMGRKFIRFSLGGMRDEAEIRGHRRTYVGAMPGRILQNIKRGGTNNPVFMLDEIDKLANDFRGDPASALLEVLDPAQNNAFNDHYLELDYDLSNVFFIATANTLESIPEPLIDRMEIVRIPGYTSLEKYEIARKYLVARQLEENGLADRNVRFRPDALKEVIDYYTREAGVRQLDRVIARICRRLARRIVGGGIADGESISVNAALVRELLGVRKFTLDEAERNPEVGVVMGMAWTSAGGVILPVEAMAIPGGKGELKLTGSLGKVMQESAAAAYTFVRANAEVLGINLARWEKSDIHIHVPDGATPKDGPSAGVTMTTALVSLMSGRKVDNKLAMTGEITLHGKVTAIGGVREKVIAALRAGMTRVILPKENAKDASELPEEVKKNLELLFAENIFEVENAALLPAPGRRKKF